MLSISLSQRDNPVLTISLSPSGSHPPKRGKKVCSTKSGGSVSWETIYWFKHSTLKRWFSGPSVSLSHFHDSRCKLMNELNQTAISTLKCKSVAFLSTRRSARWWVTLKSLKMLKYSLRCICVMSTWNWNWNWNWKQMTPLYDFRRPYFGPPRVVV